MRGSRSRSVITVFCHTEVMLTLPKNSSHNENNVCCEPKCTRFCYAPKRFFIGSRISGYMYTANGVAKLFRKVRSVKITQNAILVCKALLRRCSLQTCRIRYRKRENFLAPSPLSFLDQLFSACLVFIPIVLS